MAATSDRLLAVATGIVVTCAVVLTGLFVKRELGGQQTGMQVRRVSEWREYASSGHAIGPASAKLTIVEFADFECPACAGYEAIIDSLRRGYPDRVRIVYRHFPLESIHPRARALAEASECAGAQGRFWEFKAAAFRLARSEPAIELDSLAHLAGVADSAQFAECVTERRFQTVVDRDVAAARRLEARGTPSLLLNDRFVFGGVDLAYLESLLR